MTDKPIIMSAESVRAILAGRKTQTRRIIKPQPAGGIRTSPFVPSGLEDMHGREVRVPYAPGDLLWVRETHTYADVDWGGSPVDDPLILVDYKADDNRKGIFSVDNDTADNVARWIEDREVDGNGDNWRSPIYMPRWASRITLEVTGVRAERLRSITHEDALAEGIVWRPRQRSSSVSNYDAQWDYATLWDSLNAKRGYPWKINPWVWVIEFKRMEVEDADAARAVPR